MKPVAKSQGKGIFLFRKLKDIMDWKKDGTRSEEQKDAAQVESYVAQRYIENPYLINGRKFDHIKFWMQHNFLKLNSNKTELLLISSKSTLSKTHNLTVTIDGTPVSPSTQARNLGVIFDPTLSLEPHIRQVVKTSFFHLRNIAKLRPSLTRPAAERLIHAFISSCLDYCNSLLYGISSTSLSRLQRVQNAAARLLTHTKSWHHITPVLK
ncbi:protein polyglycylase TTLL10-like isoform X2 [Gymnodraco acuticeps]|uniref:Protein polyglycylase TTLL10-like isoform X2 n=2 Tax=Gymnodraco acuticeps TaxID=8218 RepID=A0A6P8TM56_GYMAC|nr:protein polyglycylase TTLL10-like isoform X2 [Gymnodraco acuticeps]